MSVRRPARAEVGISAAFSLLYNAYAYRNLVAQFGLVPLAEVYRETERIEKELPLPVQPEFPRHPLHPGLPFDEEEKKDTDGS